jgi:hypothetical protein
MKFLRYRFWKLIGWLFQYPIKQVLLLQEPKPNPAQLVHSPNVWDQIIQDRLSKIERDKQEARKAREDFIRSNTFKSAFTKLIDFCLQRFEHESGTINVGAYDVELSSDDAHFNILRERAIEILTGQGAKASSYGHNLICVNAKSFGELIKKIKSGNFPVREKLETITEGPYR